MFTTVRTRSNPYFESPMKASSPMRPKHAVTPVRRPPKRRKLGTGLRSRLFADSDSDDASQRLSRVASRQAEPAGPRSESQSRRTDLTLKIPARTLNAPSNPSPRKRKRTDKTAPTSDGGSWIETEDEAPEFIAEDDQNLLHVASAHTLHRLKKDELVRLWKVAGMWYEEDEEAEGRVREKSKVDLVTGLLELRKRYSESVSKPVLAKPVDTKPRSLRAPRSQSTSTLTSLGTTSSDSEHRDAREIMDVDDTPRPLRSAKCITRDTVGEPSRSAKPKGRGAKPRVKAVQRADGRHARFGDNVLSPLGTRPTRRSSTTDSAGEGPSTPLRRPPIRSMLSQPKTASDGVRSTPLIRRLRPRTRRSAKSSASTEVDADDEDNADVTEHEVGTSSRRRANKAATRRARHQRLAKRRALKALEENNSDSSWLSEDEDEDEDAELAMEKGSQHSDSLSKSTMKTSGSQSSRRSTRLDSVRTATAMDVEGTHDVSTSARTTRSGKSFGDMRLAGDNDFMDEDAEDTSANGTLSVDLSSATLSYLTKLRRDDLVKLCESRNLEVGGTKPQLAKALLEWQDEQSTLSRVSTSSSQSTIRGSPPPPKVVPKIATDTVRDGQATPVLLREHIHATDPATPPRSDDDAEKNPENDLNLDLQELGLEDFTIKPEHLQKLEKIGSGGFKDVYVGKLRGRKVAISEFRDQLSEMDMRELKLLAEFSHPNIVRFRGICIPEDSSQIPCMLISELCENGDLFDYIRNVPPPPLKRVLRLMLDIARGLEYLHLRKPAIIHRDCKSTNILISRGGVAKVGDFGLARVKHTTRSMIRSLVGTVNWQAPELWHPNPRYDYKVDVFSAALVYWEMLSGWAGEKKYPWEGHNEHYIYEAVGQKHRRPSLAGLRKHWGSEPVNLIERMWHQDPAERPTMSDVVADLEALLSECK